MNKKVGRNDKCPCGSGKKFKNCCIDNESFFDTEENKSFDFRSYFSRFHTIDLVTTIAALSLNPANHGKNLRIDYLTSEALASHPGSDTGVNPIELDKIFIKHLPHHYLEDPPENMFTENVSFTTGNNVVYGGNFEQGAFTLNTLAKVISFHQELFPVEFAQIIINSFHLLLKLSDRIALRTGHKRNMTGLYAESPNEISFSEDLSRCKQALLFEKEWVKQYCQMMGMDIAILNPFILRKDDIAMSNIAINGERNPILRKVLVETDDGIIVVGPTNIVISLVHFTWAQSTKFGCTDRLIQLFHTSVLSELKFEFRRCGWRKVNFEFKSKQDNPSKYLLYQIDSDKLVLMSLTYDEGHAYSAETICHSDPMTNISRSDADLKEILTDIHNQFVAYKIMELQLYSSIGRYYMIKSHLNQDHLSEMTSAYKFLMWARSGKHDRMELWYFEKYKRDFRKRVDIAPFVSFLDLISFYRSRGESFYLNDEQLPTFLIVPPGEGFDIVKDGVVKTDEIVAYYHHPDFDHPVLLPVIKSGDYIVRYANKDNRPFGMDFLLPNFPFDFWVKTKKGIEEMSDRRNVYWEFSEAICYWINQLLNDIYEDLKPVRQRAVDFIFDYEDKLGSNGKRWNSKDPLLATKISLDVTPSEINLYIPSEIDSYIGAPDNAGERVLVKNILYGFSALLDRNSLPNTLTEERVNFLLEKHAPFGLKKMILLLDTENDAALDPRFLKSPRFPQDAPEQMLLDEIIPMLKDKCPPRGKLKDKSDKVDLCKNIVLNVLLPRLRSVLSNYNSLELLIKFMENYESLINANGLRRVKTPTRMLCFKESENIVNAIQTEMARSDEATLAVRCIIEHLAAEPSKGSGKISTEIMDEIVSIMTLVIFWGNQGSIISDELFDVELSVLPSGRIGTNSRAIKEDFFQSFHEAKAREFLHQSQLKFSRKAEKRIDVPESLNIAFEEQFGVSLPKLGGVLKLLCEAGFRQETPVQKMRVSELKDMIKESFDEHFSDEEIDSIFSFLSLKNRGRVETVPIGFNSNDISPWRYNRRLSYLQKPLIFVDYYDFADDPVFLWSPRTCDQAWNFLSDLIFSGRYKAPEKSKLESSISKVSQQRRVRLQNKAVRRMREISEALIEEEVGIKPKGRLKHNLDIGDIDILLIDSKKKVLLSIECKRTEPSRNVREMAEEVEKYIRVKKGYIAKHLLRHSWILEHKQLIETTYSLDLTDFSVYSLFITNEVLSIQFMKNVKVSLPIISMYELNGMNYDEFITKVVEESAELNITNVFS